jgi:expansin (peptidoglycan-binding protein)
VQEKSGCTRSFGCEWYKKRAHPCLLCYTHSTTHSHILTPHHPIHLPSLLHTMQFSAIILSALSLALVASAAPSPLKRTSHTAPATWFYQGGNAGSCGTVHKDSDYVVAMPAWLHKASSCGDYISITKGKKTIKAKIADTCPGCSGYHIDLSVGAFSALASKSAGEVEVTWHKV